MKPMITDDNGISADLLNAFKCGREKVTSLILLLRCYNFIFRNATNGCRSTTSTTANNYYLSNKEFLVNKVYECIQVIF